MPGSVKPSVFSTAISFAFPPPGYWLGYYGKYFTSEEWLEPTLNSFVIAFGAMTLTMLLVVPAAYLLMRRRSKSAAARIPAAQPIPSTGDV